MNNKPLFILSILEMEVREFEWGFSEDVKDRMQTKIYQINMK